MAWRNTLVSKFPYWRRSFSFSSLFHSIGAIYIRLKFLRSALVWFDTRVLLREVTNFPSMLVDLRLRDLDRIQRLIDKSYFFPLNPLHILLLVSHMFWGSDTTSLAEGGLSRLTVSMESWVMYLVVRTARLCPIRCALFTACASAIGFQWGSRRCTWLAAVRLSL